MPPRGVSNEELAASIGYRRATALEARSVGLRAGWTQGGSIISTAYMRKLAGEFISRQKRGAGLVPYREYVEFWAATHDMSYDEARSDPKFQQLWRKKEANRRALSGTRGKPTPQREQHIQSLIDMGILEKKDGTYGYTNAWIAFTLRFAA